MREMDKLVRISSIDPVSDTGAVTGDYVSLKNFSRCVVGISLGVINTSVTVQLRQATDVSGTGVKALNFDHVWRQGGKIATGAHTGTFTVGETITGGTSSATAVVYAVYGDSLILHTVAGTLQTAETLTGGTSGATATSTSALTHAGMKMRVDMTAANTVVLTQDAETFEIEVDPASLDVANGFDCVLADISAIAGGAALVQIEYLLTPKYAYDAQHTPLID